VGIGTRRSHRGLDDLDSLKGLKIQPSRSPPRASGPRELGGQ
jgi:hypothetical protein